MALAMSAATWRALSVFLLLVVLMQFYLIISHTRHTVYRAPPQPPQVITAPTHLSPGQWRFETERDANNPALTTEQCDAAFPDLYHEIDRSVQWWQDRNYTIQPEDVEIAWRHDGAMRVLIYNNQLRVLQAKHIWQPQYYKRALPMLSQLHRALLGASAMGEMLPNIEFSVTVDDHAMVPPDDMRTIWSFSRNIHDKVHDKQWIMPDFNFWVHRDDSFYDMQTRAQALDLPFGEKIPKVVWRGVKWTNGYVRGHLLDKTKGKEWADVKEMDWESQENFMRMEELCRYAFVVHTEGRSWSGRLKYILNCNSVAIIHNLDWTTHLYHLLIPDGPDQNYLPTDREFSGLQKKVKRLLVNPEKAQKIADNAVKTFRDRYSTMAAESCYWRRMVKGWSQVAFAPELFETRTVEVDGREFAEKVIRGKAYEWMVLATEEEVLEWAGSQEEG